MESIGAKIRHARRRLGLTLDELTGRTGISKPYLSLIENGRLPNPPSDAKLRLLEQTLGFVNGELVQQAHLMRTPRDIRQVLSMLMRAGAEAKSDGGTESQPTKSMLPSDLDAAYLSGVLQELVEKSAGNVESVRMNAVPIINRVSAGYPKDFTDLSYPRGVADDFVSCPDVHDPDAFAARVHGDSMSPKYSPGDIVIFSPAAATRHGDDCFVRFDDGQTTFKRVFFEKDDAENAIIRLQPRNERYKPQSVKPEQITGIYRAMFRYQSVDDLQDD